MTDREEQIELLLDQYEEGRAKHQIVSVDELCADHPQLREEVSRRIQKLNALDALLGDSNSDQSVSMVPNGQDRPDTLPAWIVEDAARLPAGRYRPIEFHARGGLGEIFVAEDMELGRQVALKRMNDQQGRIPTNCRRFEVEAMITGRLEHPGIVPIYGLGHDESGRPVYAMRLIRGESLEEAIQQFHAAMENQSKERNARRGLQQLLRRFLSVCETIAFAHSHDVVHRDIKPSNIMLGDYGETLVVDWGLARAAHGTNEDDQESFVAPSVAVDKTRLGEVKGSPAYMSPEQAAGRSDIIGPKSDVYSLGATLYRLLTGDSPFGPGVVDALVAVKRGEFPRPRLVNKAVPAPLEAICLKAMSVEPNDRYATPLALAEDIEHWLADEPVSAWPDPLIVRCNRWVKRHRTLVATGAVASIVALASLGIATTLLSRTNQALFAAQQVTQRALEQTQSARDRAEHERERAEQSLETGLDAVRRMLLRVGHEDLADVPEMQQVQQRILEDAVDFLEGFVGFESSSSLQREQGLAMRYLGNVHSLLGNRHRAEQSFAKALEIQQSLVDANPVEPRGLQELGITMHDWGRFLMLRDSAAAKQACEQSVRLLEPLLSTMPHCQRPLAEAFNTLGILDSAAGDAGPAEANYLRSITLREQLLGAAVAPETEPLRHELAKSHHNVGNLRQVRGRTSEAQASFEKALEIWEKPIDDLLLSRRREMGLQEVYNSLAALHQSNGDVDQAESYYLKALRVREELARLYPHVKGHQDNLARSYLNLGALFHTTNRHDRAMSSYERAVEIRGTLAVEYPEDEYLQVVLAETYLNLALLRHTLQRMDQAEDSFRHAQEILSTLVANFPETIRYQNSLAANETNYGNFLRARGQTEESLQLHQAAIDRLERVLTTDPDNVEVRQFLVSANGSRANTLIELESYAEAVAHCDRVVELSHPGERDQHRMWRAIPLARLDHVRAVDEARALAELDELSGVDYYNLACVCSVALHTARDTFDADEWKSQTIKLAMTFLEQAQDAGAFNTPEMQNTLRTDADLNALRADEAFADFLKRVGHDDDESVVKQR